MTGLFCPAFQGDEFYQRIYAECQAFQQEFRRVLYFLLPILSHSDLQEYQRLPCLRAYCYFLGQLILLSKMLLFVQGHRHAKLFFQPRKPGSKMSHAFFHVSLLFPKRCYIRVPVYFGLPIAPWAWIQLKSYCRQRGWDLTQHSRTAWASTHFFQ